MTGSGTLVDPYVIWDVNDLQNACELDCYYELGQDINAAACAAWHDGDGFIPLGWDGVARRRPTSDIAEVGGAWAPTPAAPATKFDKVADPYGSPDEDATYITAAIDGQRIIFGFDAYSIPSWATNIGVIVYARCKEVAAGVTSFTGSLRVGGVDFDNIWPSNIVAYYSDWSWDWLTNPATGLAWTRDQIMGIGADTLDGFGCLAADATPNIRVTQTWIEVFFSAPLGTGFRGHFDGKGFVISNLFQHRPLLENQALFASAIDSVIQNVYLSGVNITGLSEVGGLMGYAFTSVGFHNCHVSGTIHGFGNNIGGLIGWLSDGCVLEDCDTDVVLTAEGSMVGGLIGWVDWFSGAPPPPE